MSDEAPSELDCWGNEDPVYPHCGSVNPLSGDDYASISFEEDTQNDFACNGCGETYIAVAVVDYTFSTALDQESAEDGSFGSGGSDIYERNQRNVEEK